MNAHTASKRTSRFGPRPALGLVLLLSGLTAANAASYSSQIEFREDFVKILDRNDIVWDAAKPNYHNFSGIQVSAGGSRLLFNVTCEFCDPALGHKNRIFLANPDGTGLRDISNALYPSDISSSWSGWGSLRLNDDGSRVFIRTHRNVGSYYGEFHWYVYATGGGSRSDAIQNPFRYLSATIDTDGSRLYFEPYDAGWSEALKRKRVGLFYADLGGAATIPRHRRSALFDNQLLQRQSPLTQGQLSLGRSCLPRLERRP